MDIAYKANLFSQPFHKINDILKPKPQFDNESRVEVKFNQKSETYLQTMDWLKKHKEILIGGMILPEYHFLKEEVEGFEIYYIGDFTTAPSPMFGSEYGTQYQKMKCSIFASKDTSNTEPSVQIDAESLPDFEEKAGIFSHEIELNQQISPLYIDTSKLANMDFQITLSNEIIISNKLRKLLERDKITGWTAEPIYNNKKRTGTSDREQSDLSKEALNSEWFQFKVKTVAPTMVAPTKFGYSYIALSAHVAASSKEKLITDIALGSWPHFDRTSFPNSDFVATCERKISEYPLSLIVFSRRVYDLLVENDIKGYNALPAFFSDNPAALILESTHL